jgi:fibronectin-binding autotransporter adhesin
VAFTGNSVIGGTNGPDGLPASIGTGGAIYNSLGSLNITNCAFSNNIAVGGAGRTYSVNNPNGGDARGGAIGSGGGVVNLDGSGIVANSSIGGPSGLGGIIKVGNALGGGLYAAAGTVAIRNCNFMTNATTVPTNPYDGYAGQAEGGGIYEEAGVVLRITGSTFGSNSARGGTAFYHDEPASGYGGALFINGTLNCTNCSFAGNYTIGGSAGLPKAADAMGGAIYNQGTANIINATISGNHTLGGTATAQFNGPLSPGFAMGGGIYNGNVVLLLNSTLSGNFATGGTGTPNIPNGPGGTGLGGAIYNVGKFTGTNNTIFGNLAIGGDGGLENTNRWGPSGVGYGGGIYNDTTNGTVILTHQTLSDNSVEHGSSLAPITMGIGGGIYSTNGTVTLRNTIVANSPSGTNCWGSIIDGGGNISSDASLSFTAPGSHTNTNPVLGPLGNYGGPTQTMPILAGSPALDAGTAAFCPATDQRGVVRPFGAGCDIGAYESAPPYNISGQVRCHGVTGTLQMTLGTNSVGTDANGNYFVNAFGAGGLYAVSPSAAGVVFVPGSVMISLGPDVPNVNFDAYPANCLMPQTAANGWLSFAVAGAAGQTCVLQFSSDLVNWTPIATNYFENNGLVEFSNSTATGSGFLRTLVR